MNQDQFKAMLNEPKKATAPKGDKATMAEMTPEEQQRKRQQLAKRKKYRDRGRNQQEADATSTASKYRDRAAERRKGEGLADYEVLDTSMLTADETKHLGGDFEHTHLVKGLDEALLEAEIAASAGVFPEDAQEEQQPVEAERHLDPDSLAYRLLDVLELEGHTRREPVALQSVLKRTAFVFDLGRDTPATPTAVIRSSASGRRAGSVHQPLSDAVIAAVSYAINPPAAPLSEPRQAVPPQQQQQQQQVVAVEQDDEDMFADLPEADARPEARLKAQSEFLRAEETPSIFAEPAAVTALKRKADAFEKHKRDAKKRAELSAAGYTMEVTEAGEEGEDKAALRLFQDTLKAQLRATEVKKDVAKKRKRPKTKKQEEAEVKRVNAVIEEKFK